MAPSLLTVAFALVALAASARGAGCGVRCWLSALTFALPDTHASRRILGSNAAIDLTGTRISGLDVASVVSGRPAELSLNAGVAGVSAKFATHISMSWMLVDIETDVSATLENASVSVTIELGREDGLLNSTTASACRASAKLGELSFSGSFAADVLQALSGAIRAAAEEIIPAALCDDVIVPLIDVNLSRVAHDSFNVLEPFTHPPLHSILPAPPSTAGFRSMNGNALVDALQAATGDLLGSRGVSWIVSRLTRGSGALRDSDVSKLISSLAGTTVDIVDRAHLDIALPGLGNISFGLGGFSLSGLDTWESFSLFDRDEQDQYSIGGLVALKRLLLNASFSVNVSVPSDAGSVISGPAGLWLAERGGVLFGTSDSSIKMLLRAFVHTNISRMLDHQQLFNPDCVLSMFQEVLVHYLFLNTSLDTAALWAGDGNGDVELGVDRLASDLAATLIGGYQAAIPAFINAMLLTPAKSAINPLVASALEGRQCTTPDKPASYGFKPVRQGITLSGALGIASFIAFVAVALPRIVKVAKNSRNEASIALIEKNKPNPRNGGALGFLGALAEYIQGPTGGKSLMCDDRLSAALRLLLPAAVVLNIGTFLSTVGDVGAEVVMQVSWQSPDSPNHVIETTPLFEFGLTNSVEDMWKAKVYPLAILIAVMSCAWPYIKLAGLLVCWIMPANVLTKKYRNRILIALDALGKWSLIDAYAMTLMMVAFHFQVPLPQHESDSAVRPVAVEILVLPCLGFTSLMVSTILSLVLGHIILAVHKHVDELDDPDTSSQDDKSSIPVMAEFMKGADKRVAWLARTAMSLAILATLASIIVGGFITSIAFQFSGAVGEVLPMLNSSTTRTYSLLDVAVAVPKASSNPSGFDSILIEANLLVTALIVPALHMIALLVMWACPMSLKKQKIGISVMEVLNAWSSIDVYVVSIAAVLMELRQFAGFIAADMCEPINKLIEEYFSDDVPGSKVCFEVFAKLTTGSWPFIFATFSYLACTVIVMRVVHTVTSRRSSNATCISINSEQAITAENKL